MVLERKHWNETGEMEPDVVAAPSSSYAVELEIFLVQCGVSVFQEAAGPPLMEWVGGDGSCEHRLYLSAVKEVVSKKLVSKKLNNCYNRHFQLGDFLLL